LAPLSFDGLLREAEADPAVVGVFLGGSRGKGALVTERSDHDVWVVVRDDDAYRRWAERHPFRHGDPVEVILVTLEGLRTHPPDYTFAHVGPLVDRGGVAKLLDEKARVDPAGAGKPLDDYVNCYYRSSKNARDGLALEARLDAAESVPYFLEFLFAVFGRVRPYNKWLRWELDAYPLAPPWTADELPPRLDQIVAGDLEAQQALFRDAERLARDRGHGSTIDGWEPDVRWLRGDPSTEG
jgi:hypothetical protein